MSEEGSLQTFLGTAPGAGKTFAMLAEGRRGASNGERVLVGWIEWHGRPQTRRQRTGPLRAGMSGGCPQPQQHSEACACTDDMTVKAVLDNLYRYA